MLKRANTYLKLALVFAAVSSGILLLIPLRRMLSEEAMPLFSAIVAVLFWATLAAGQYFFWAADQGRKKIQARSGRDLGLKGQRIGLLNVFTNPEGTAADITFAVTFLTVVLLDLFRVRASWLSGIATAVMLTAFHCHCIFNGVTYRYIKAFQTMKKEKRKYESN